MGAIVHRRARQVNAAPAVIPTPPPNPLFVDTVGGLDSNAGTQSAPLLTVGSALLKASGYPNYTVRVAAPTNAPIRNQYDLNSDFDVTLDGWDSQPWNIMGSVPITGSAGWSNPSGTIWSRTLTATTVGCLTVTTMTETFLAGTLREKTFARKLNRNTATPTTPAAGEYGHTANVLYVNLPDGSAATGHTFEAATRNFCFTTVGKGRLTLRNMVAQHVNTTAAQVGVSTALPDYGRLSVYDSLIQYVGTAGTGQGCGVGGVGHWVDMLVQNTKIYRVANDGVNVHATDAYTPTATVNGGESSYHGDADGASAQGASNHETTTMILNGGLYVGSVSGGMVVIDTARCDLHGDTTWGKVTMDRNLRLGDTTSPLSGQGGCAWLNGSVGTVTGPVEVTNSGGRNVVAQTTTGAAVVGANTITSTGGARPDNLAA